MMKYLKSIYKVTGLLAILLCTSGCRKLVEVPGPTTSTNSANVYTSDATAAAVLTGIYTNMSSKGVFGGPSSTSLYLSLTADELGFYQTSNNVSYLPFYQNALSNSNLIGGDFWSGIYPMIFVTNAAIEGLTNNKLLTPVVDQQLLGEALFMRAFCYFYLVNIYGDVPLATSTDFKTNQQMARTAKAQVYQQIITDLKTAQGLLNDYYVDATALKPSADRLRPSRWAATALLARAYLYNSDWANAEQQAGLVIANNSLFTLPALNSAFLATSKEAIWQLQSVNSGVNTPDGALFILPVTGPNNTNFVYLSKNLLNSFETGDQRLTSWVSNVTVPVGTVPTTYAYAYKYKVNTGSSLTEHEMVLRLGEQYLIRAEARARLGNTTGAASDLNVIRSRAGLPGTLASGQDDLLTAIYHERQVELFTEWGHRWLDLKRTGLINTVMSIAAPQKGGTWNEQKQLFPLPLADLSRNPNLVQNPSY
ncbi:MAG TPA: RagB/SusD family nutrient uptake outer membrane protein [Pedobacter sp.]